MKILIVEDDNDIRAMLVDLFQESGFDVLEAEHGRAALAVLSEAGTPDIMLLDMLMPIMDGATLLETLGKFPSCRDLPVVVVSADSTIRPRGAVALVRKPFDTEQLLEIVSRHLRISES